jgi:hypothetical protein
VLPCDLLLGASCGFTGSRHGITAFQRAALMSVLWDVKPLEAHYGDCAGADYEFFMICKALRVRTVSHPGDDERWRMFTLADVLRDPKPNLDRNRDIVAECDYLIACPGQETMILRSGTWATVRHARSAGRTTLLILPSGRVDVQRVDLLSWKSSSCPRT